MIRTVSIGILVFLLTHFFIENSPGQNFQLPAEEILKKYLNITGAELMKKCTAKDKCLASKVVDLSNEKKLAGENLIIHIVNEAKKLHSVTENDWNNLIKNHCQSSPFFIVSLQISFGYTGGCLSAGQIPSPDLTNKAIEEYKEIYCSRVKASAKRKFQSGN
ncbi:uncharacterized protein LOC127281103 [Leptopilina boulardi]|uniref:uncharacterized protein LOC127281103 n=1 Tax=Leptopilina boulardi TaxID=63433 RepID=UPI0021F4FF42|nr:uncharacterized protein LOC127281103 [Leptopilina boulardi]